MAWVVDTCILLDVLQQDPLFGVASARTLESLQPSGLTLCPISYAELAPAFLGNLSLQNHFLRNVGVDYEQEWRWSDTLTAHDAWNRLTALRRRSQATKRPIADVLIGAFALRFDGLVTRNKKDFSDLFPRLELVVPS
jgi:predicted nucleic acid-binding protein